MGGEGACTWRVYTQTHTQLHLFIKEYCTVLHGYCDSRLKIEICRCTILYATEHDCLAKTQCKRIAGIFGANGGRNASATLLLFSPLIFSFLPLPSSATQSWWRLTGSARSRTSSRLRSVAVPGFGKQRARGSGRSCPEATTARRAKQVPAGIFPIRIKYLFFFFFANFNTKSIPVFLSFLAKLHTCETLRQYQFIYLLLVE